jgi:hypothetical protein
MSGTQDIKAVRRRIDTVAKCVAAINSKDERYPEDLARFNKNDEDYGHRSVEGVLAEVLDTYAQDMAELVRLRAYASWFAAREPLIYDYAHKRGDRAIAELEADPEAVPEPAKPST